MTFVCIHGVVIGSGEPCIRCGYSPMGASGRSQDPAAPSGETRGVRLPAASTIPTPGFNRAMGTIHEALIKIYGEDDA